MQRSATTIALPAFRCLMVGAPGSGKGTISTRLAETFGLDHLSSGDVLRRHQLEQTDLGKAADTHLRNGTLVPDRLMVNLMLHEVRHLDQSGNAKMVLDGEYNAVSTCRTRFAAHRTPYSVFPRLVAQVFRAR